jgi:alginate O-acetyltransferase complex protein AlgI
MIGWVFFRADTVPGALAFLEAMAGLSPALATPFTVAWFLTPELWLALLAGAIGSTPWLPALGAKLERLFERAERPAIEWTVGFMSTASLAALLVASIMQMAARTYNPFIYFRF